jgi:BASS family bile acid:Na+ symporter
MARIKFLFSRSHILFLLAIVIGMLLPQVADFASLLTYPALTVILTIALLRFPRGFFRRQRPFLSGAIWGNLMNYLILGNLIIMASYFLIREEGFWIGMVLIAAAPPATTIIPLGNILRIDKQSMFSGMAGTYLGAVLIAPLIGYGFLKFIPLDDPMSLILAIFMLILLPLFLSWLAVNEDWDKLIEDYKGPITDGCFFVIFYALVSSTRYMIIHRPLDVVFMFVIAAISTFLLGFIINLLGNYYGASKEKISSLVFLGTMKNYALAGAIALNVFNKQAALPALVFSIVTFVYTIWLKYKMGNVVDLNKTNGEPLVKMFLRISTMFLNYLQKVWKALTNKKSN